MENENSKKSLAPLSQMLEHFGQNFCLHGNNGLSINELITAGEIISILISTRCPKKLPSIKNTIKQYTTDSIHTANNTVFTCSFKVIWYDLVCLVEQLIRGKLVQLTKTY